VAPSPTSEPRGTETDPRADEKRFENAFEDAPTGHALTAPEGKIDLDQHLRQEENMEAVGRLAGGVAHDFNNLLFVIKNYVGLTVAAMPPSDPARADLRQALEAADRAQELVRKLLAFSRKSIARPRVVDVSQLVRDMEQMLRRTAGEDVRMIVNTPRPHMRALTDPVHIEEIVVTLVANARDAMPEGGTLTIETTTTNVGPAFADRHPGLKMGEYVVLSVTDTGTGMSPEVAGHVFEPFFTTKSGGTGTGLGLAAVYGIVKQADGHVLVRTELDRGATFEVYLPYHTVDVDLTTGSIPASGRAPGGGELVLVAEDETVVRDLVCRILTEAGYDVIEATSGAHALDLVRGLERRVDALVTDIVMPEMNGRDLAVELARVYPGIRVLFMSGYPGPVVEQLATLEGIGRDYVQKPFSSEVLLEKLGALLVPA
jgi:signal transduction histidine kinase